MSLKTILNKLLANNKPGEAIDLLIEKVKDSDPDTHNTLILLKSRYVSNEKDNNMGILSNSDYQRSRNQIVYAFQQTMDKVPKKFLENTAGENQNQQEKTIKDYEKEYSKYTLEEAKKELQKVNKEIAELENQPKGRKKVLMISSTPNNEPTIRFDNEISLVEHKLEYSKTYTLSKTKFKVENTDIAPLIISEKPDIVHFSVHGDDSVGLLFTNNANERINIDLHEFETWLSLLTSINIRCYVFNACFSSGYAKLASNYAEYAVGMNDYILEPDAALAFTEGFYSWLKVEDNIESAFKSGINNLYSKREKLTTRDGKIQHKIPELYKNGQLLIEFNLSKK